MADRVVPDEGPFGKIDAGVADMDGVVSRRIEIQDQEAGQNALTNGRSA